MAKVPEPLAVLDWPQVSRQYYELLLNPATRLDGKPLITLQTSKPSFDIAFWVGKNPGDEAFALYMGNHIGFLGSIMALTDVPGILRWDCLATDWFHDAAEPTFLFFNPHAAPKTFQTDIGPKVADLYDAVTHQFMQRKVRGQVPLTLAPETAAVVVVTPVNAKRAREGRRMLVDGLGVNYQAGADGD